MARLDIWLEWIALVWKLVLSVLGCRFGGFGDLDTWILGLEIWLNWEFGWAVLCHARDLGWTGS